MTTRQIIVPFSFEIDDATPQVLFRAPAGGERIVSVDLISDVATTSGETDFLEIGLLNIGLAGGEGGKSVTLLLADVSTEDADFAANVPYSLAIATNADFNQGEMLALTIDATGTNPAAASVRAIAIVTYTEGE